LISSSARIAINLAERKNDDPFPLNAPLFTAKMINGYGLDQALADFSVLANMRYASPADFSFGNDKFKCFIFGGKLMVHTLIVEDDSHIRKIMSLYLKKEGFNIVEASNGHEALVKINSHPIDLVILDIMLPEKDGWEVCQEIRKRWDTPILMVTAKRETDQKIKGLELGADDYIVKPFDPLELVARVKALLRRARIVSSKSIQIGNTTIDAGSYTVSVCSQTFTLPPKEFELLFHLASYPGQIFTRNQLIERIWGMDYKGEDRTVDVHIKRLRQRFTHLTKAFQITTVRGLGYRLDVLP
jgi:two-component system, OmpR family, response regulator